MGNGAALSASVLAPILDSTSYWLAGVLRTRAGSRSSWLAEHHILSAVGVDAGLVIECRSRLKSSGLLMPFRASAAVTHSKAFCVTRRNRVHCSF
jgi:hypothetical protein